MRNESLLSLPKWPFFLGDVVLLALAYFIYFESRLPLGHWEMTACGICVALGALLGVLPFLLDYRALNKAVEAEALGAVSDKILNLERLAAQISSATNAWENVHLQAEKTSMAAKEITERMAAEVRDFTEFMQKINEGEKATLRLEVEKLRRAEGDWLQVLTHVLDHVYALHSGAVRSGQPRLVEQLSQFQNACRDAARRVGLTAFAPTAGDAFDPRRHKSADGDSPPPAGAAITETLATGYTLQARVVRPALVRIESGQKNTDALPLETQSADAAQDQLPLETSAPS
jgi:molecular chaperone GrpE (heat shock protein)